MTLVSHGLTMLIAHRVRRLGYGSLLSDRHSRIAEYLLNSHSLMLRPNRAFLVCRAVWQGSRCGVTRIRYERHGALFDIVPLKCIKRYLSLSMTTIERCDAIIHHFRFMKAHLVVGGALKAASLSTVLWVRVCSDLTLSLQLEQSSQAALEGEMTLQFYVDGSRFYYLTFSVVAGSLANIDAESVLFVGGVQGVVDQREKIRRVSKANNEVAPIDCLLLALRCVAEALAIDWIAGVASASQVSQAYASEGIVFDYDAFWTKLHGVKTTPSVYVLARNQPERPLLAVPLTHRARTRRKREYKAKICDEILTSLRDVYRK